jgi:hypothetical protein
VTCLHFDGGVACSFSDPRDYRIKVPGKYRGEKVFTFDFSERFGPLVVGADGREVAQPGPRHPFWTAVTQWHKQGKRVGDDGLCVWEPEPPMDLSDFVQVGKRTWVQKSIFERWRTKEGGETK